MPTPEEIVGHFIPCPESDLAELNGKLRTALLPPLRIGSVLYRLCNKAIRSG
jgi:hypothetical protein